MNASRDQRPVGVPAKVSSLTERREQAQRAKAPTAGEVEAWADVVVERHEVRIEVGHLDDGQVKALRLAMRAQLHKRGLRCMTRVGGISGTLLMVLDPDYVPTDADMQAAAHAMSAAFDRALDHRT